jgi:hypothetical protein
MGELIQMGRVVFDGNDPRAPYRESPRVIQMPKPELSEQEKALQPLLKELDEVENFVVFVHTKKGGFKIVPCLDRDLNLWAFVDVFRSFGHEAGRGNKRSIRD